MGKRLKKIIRLFANLLFTISIFLLRLSYYPWRILRVKQFAQLKDSQINDILIMYMGEGLGDCILFSGTLPAIKEKFKNAKISLLALDRFREYFQDNPYINQFFGYPDYKYARGGFRKFLSYSGYLKQHSKPDILIDLLPNRFIKPAVFSWFIPKRISLGFDYSVKKIFYDICVKIDWEKYFYDSFFDLLKYLGIPQQQRHYWLPQYSYDRDYETLNNFPGKTIVLAPGGKFNLIKCKEYGGFSGYPDLVISLAEKGYRIILVGAEYDQDVQFLEANLPQDKLINLIGKTSITQLFFLVKNYADLVISNTSGLLYVALACGVPAVFYAHPLENLKRWHPSLKGDSYVALRDTAQQPLTVDAFYATVVNKIEGLLEEKGNA